MALTDSQKKAVQVTGKNILVSAGAGTGKTHMLVERILHILKTQKALITELLVLTFTEKAANEIKTRLSKELRILNMEQSRRDLEKAAISTFHSFASRLLKEHPIEAAVDPEFRVIETEQSELLKEEAFQETIKKIHEDKADAFELLADYGEETVREGVYKIFTAARHEGKTLEQFFFDNDRKRNEICEAKEKELPRTAEKLLRKLEEIDANGWQRFLQSKEWDWKKVQAFREWNAPYAAKRKEGWKEWRELLKDLVSLRIQFLAAPWEKRLEQMAFEFERLYDGKKKEEGWLDFDDLQMKAVRLFSGEQLVSKKLRERYQKQFRWILIDEFQDTNFLQMRFAELLSTGDNLFMVGDYKQSIYGFRGAEPRIFLEKENLYKKNDDGQLIFLSESFRSEPAVLDFANRFFKVLWEEDHFPFEPLVPKRKQMVAEPVVEVLVTEMSEEEDKEHARMREARTIAARIQELHEKQGIPYGDVAVLFQAMTLSGIYEDALKTAGIPYFIVAGRGFYEQPEIQDMICFLNHLEKPFQDIPLAATLRSPLFHITDDTLFWLSRYAKAQNAGNPLFHAVQDLTAIKEISEEQLKLLRFFVTLTQELQALKDRISIADLIDRILQKTGYELSVLADPLGVRRFANLKKLMAIARDYETHERIPLAVFLNILKRLKAQEVRESEAPIALETGADAVRVMSIHAAKGLEFETVFVADMGHQGNYGGSKAVIAHAADGYGLRVRNERNLEMETPYFYQVLDQAIKKREDEEWKRLLYVAITRAKSRLFLSGVYEEKKKPKELFSEMSSWMDWAVSIGESLKVRMTYDADKGAGFPAQKFSIKKEGIAQVLEKISKKPVSKLETLRAQSLTSEKERFLSRTIDLPVSAYVLFQKDPQAFWRVYQIGWTVEGHEEVSEEPKGEEGEVSAADFGTAMHSLFEYMDFRNPEKCLGVDFLGRIFSGFGKKAVPEVRKLVEGFAASPVFKQLQKAKRIEREVDFVLNERHGLIHGKVDALFEDEKGEWYILDYKTAVGDEDAARESGYQLQMEIYALAAKKILKIPIHSGMIYYLKNQKVVTLPLQTYDFDKLEKKIDDLQERILDYSNKRICLEEKPFRVFK